MCGEGRLHLDRVRGGLRRAVALWLVVVLSACTPLADNRQPLPERLPNDDYGVYVGCMRAVARLTVQSRAYWTIDEMADFCEDVRRSFDEDRRRSMDNDI